jgi:tripartite ATP-independent transporter DctM subunit
MVPVIVVVGIVGGIASPTEASSFAVVYGLAIAVLGYGGLNWRTGWPAIRDATLTAGMVLFMVATANLLSQAIVIDGLGRSLSAFFGSFQERQVFLLVSMAAMIVIGFVLEGFPAILISAPILLPVAERMGVDPLQYGIILVIAIGIGVFMPPIGVGYYVACTVGEAPPNATMRPSVVYNVFLILGLAIAILFPQITLFLPHHFGMH